jgi:hypothetical protein
MRDKHARVFGGKPLCEITVNARRTDIPVCLVVAGIFHKQSSSGILPHNGEEPQDAAVTNDIFE